MTQRIYLKEETGYKTDFISILRLVHIFFAPRQMAEPRFSDRLCPLRAHPYPWPNGNKDTGPTFLPPSRHVTDTFSRSAVLLPACKFPFLSIHSPSALQRAYTFTTRNNVPRDYTRVSVFWDLVFSSFPLFSKIIN